MNQRRIETDQPGVFHFAKEGASAFAVGFAVTILCCLPGFLFFPAFALVPIGFVIGGAVGGRRLSQATGTGDASEGTPIGFGIGFLVPGLILPFSIISLDGGVSVSYGAISWGIGLSIAGAIGSLFLRDMGQRPIRFLSLAYRFAAGGFAFGVAGLIGGATGFALFGVFSGPGSLLPVSALFAGLAIAYTLGGTLLGAALGYGN